MNTDISDTLLPRETSINEIDSNLSVNGSEDSSIIFDYENKSNP